MRSSTIVRTFLFNPLLLTHWKSAGLLCSLLPGLVWGEAVDGLNVFSDGEVIYAEQINENSRYIMDNYRAKRS